MKKSYDFILFISSFIILLTASILSIFSQPTPDTLLPFARYSVPAMNIICTALCLSLLWIKNKNAVQYIILGIQVFSTTITGYETLGAFLMTVLILLLFSNGFFKTAFKQKISIILTVWFLICLTVIPFGILRFLLQIATSFFFGGFFIYIYQKLSDELSVFLPAKISSSKDLPQPGEVLNLKDYGLSDRQIVFVKEVMNKHLTYGQLAQKYNTSPSTVKKDMQKIFSLLGVKNLNSLTILLLQYRVE